MHARMRATLLFTGSPRSRCSLAMTKGCLCWRTGALMTWAPWSASTHATRRAGPGPRDDMFLSSFYSEIFLYRHPGAGRDPFSIVIPAQAGIHCAAGICVAYATPHLNFALCSLNFELTSNCLVSGHNPTVWSPRHTYSYHC